MTIIRTKWVFRNKLAKNGIVSQNKARLVAQGYNQQEGIDYDETYAPVARLESIRILLAYAYALDFKLFQMDVKSAFLNGFINEEIYVAQPPGFIDFEKSDHVYNLKKALYGLKQAPKAWNATTKKTQRNFLKQQYENFTILRSEMLDQTFDRLQKLVSQLELLDEKLSQEDVNQKLLRSLSPEWNTHAVVWRNKAELDTNVHGNMVFVSSSNNNTSNSSEAVNAAHGVTTTSTQVNTAYSTNIDNLSDAVIRSFFASQPNSPQLTQEDLQQLYPDDIEEMDLRWQMAMLTIRARRFLKNTRNKLTVNGNETIGFDKSKVKCYNCHKRGHLRKSAELQENQDTRTSKAQEGVCACGTSTSQLWLTCDWPLVND
ncbi:retrovirus-related pol polyprotein from transposon TNT 1-94 [Tanacetum coccineum]